MMLNKALRSASSVAKFEARPIFRPGQNLDLGQADFEARPRK